MDLKRLIPAIIGGLITAIGLVIVLLYSYEPITGWGFWLGLIGFTYLLYNLKSIKAIIGRTFTILGLEIYLLPIAILIFSAFYIKTETTGVAEGVGGFIGGTIAVGVTTLFAVFFGSVLIIAGHYISK